MELVSDRQMNNTQHRCTEWMLPRICTAQNCENVWHGTKVTAQLTHTRDSLSCFAKILKGTGVHHWATKVWPFWAVKSENGKVSLFEMKLSGEGTMHIQIYRSGWISNPQGFRLWHKAFGIVLWLHTRKWNIVSAAVIRHHGVDL